MAEDQQVRLWKLSVGGHRWKEALAECQEIGEAYKQPKEKQGELTSAEVKGVFICFPK